ncbi:MAG: hypothetical protein V7678_04595 [Brevundimonas sp.]
MTRASVFLCVLALAACEASSGAGAAAASEVQQQGRAGIIEAAQAYAISKTEVPGTEAVWAAPTPNGVATCGLLRLPTGELVAYQYFETDERAWALMAFNLDQPRLRLGRSFSSWNRVVRMSCQDHGLTIPEDVPQD